ncbi:FimV/HubP family polar landmark protein [Pseudomonas luteola]|uniref:FimV/HubP family polar landmark protein n=1 Tax=Pseudomonas luteola TaxID=47886 RepID=UPI001239B855|nr:MULTISPECIES: FimV/HubP family polar landmark protein [Pseudomonas]MBA1246840.1 tetratricopeptide repeat protein [Pseudomonas zeshuii]QEU28524.1 FimV family protein [Pseudomonas luteola]
MVRVRKLVLAIAAASAFASGATYGLGLGDIHLNSSLNQPFNAVIDLKDVRDLSAEELRPVLASPEDFSKAGVDRNYFLTDLKFTPEVRADGRSVIRITSSKPVREPYLNFLLEVSWPSGRVLREYTVLLDPPLYTPQTAAAPVAPVTAPAPSRPARPAATPVPSGAAGVPVTMNGEYTTSPKDTLWEVADRTRPNDNVSVHQMMLAIQDRNPSAFLSNNINLMKSGQVLRLPNDEQIRVRSQRQALEEVAAQNRAWRGGLQAADAANVPGSPRQLDATNRQGPESAPGAAEQQDNLRLLSGQQGKSASGSDQGNSGNNQALADKLAVTQESLDSTRRENEELKSRMSDLQSQLDKLQKLMQLKDAQLAQLQASAANQGVAPESPEASAPVITPPATTPEGEPAQPTADQSAPEQAEAAPPATPEDTAPDSASAPEVPAETPAAPSATTPAMPATAAPAQPVEPVAEEPASFLDQIFGNTLWLGVIGGSALLALLVLLMVISRRNAMREAEREAALEEEQSIGAYRVDPDIHESSLDGLDISDLSESNLDNQNTDAKQPSDALGQADIYMAYGRFNQAADVLQKASDEEPHRADLRLKLMEVYAEMGDREGFIRQENELREIGGSQPEVEQLKSRYPAMAAAAAATVLGAAALAAAHEVSESEEHRLDEPETTEKLDDDFDLNFDDFKLDDTEEPAVVREDTNTFDFTAEETTAQTAKDDDFDFDFDLSSDSERPVAPEHTALNDEFSLDLDESDRNAEPMAFSEPAVHAPEDDFSLDLPDNETKPSDVNDLSDDFDLSIDEPGAEPEPIAERETPEAANPQAHSFEAELQRANADLEQSSPDLREETVAEERKDEASTNFGSFSAESGSGLDDDFDFLSGEDETATKLDLARAYIDMGDADGARDILDEILAEGSDAQRNEAREMLAQLS